MPRNGAGVFSRPAGVQAVQGQIVDPVAYEADQSDFEADANAARPVSAGGTGASTAAQARVNLGFQAGMIMLWSGTLATIPTGWALCDGTTYGAITTPDLRDKFIVGAADGADPGATGGASSLELTVANLPAHDHAVDPPATATTADGSHSHTATTSTAGGHSHTGSTGSGGSHNHSGTTSTTGDHQHAFGINQQDNTNLGGGGLRSIDAQANGIGDTVGTTNTTGNHNHTITVSTHSGHTHSFSTSTTGNHNHTITVSTHNGHTHTVDIPSFTSGSTGSGTAFDNRPAFYALAFIMHLGV